MCIRFRQGIHKAFDSDREPPPISFMCPPLNYIEQTGNHHPFSFYVLMARKQHLYVSFALFTEPLVISLFSRNFYIVQELVHFITAMCIQNLKANTFYVFIALLAFNTLSIFI